MTAFATSKIMALPEMPHWKTLVQNKTAMSILLSSSRLRDLGDQTAHTASEELIVESVNALKRGREKTAMLMMFHAAYNYPAH